MSDHEKDDEPKPGMLQVISSVLAAGLGVQSSKNRERDFEKGSPTAFIVTGLVFTVLFIAVVVGIVSTVLSNVG